MVYFRVALFSSILACGACGGRTEGEPSGPVAPEPTGGRGTATATATDPTLTPLPLPTSTPHEIDAGAPDATPDVSPPPPPPMCPDSILAFQQCTQVDGAPFDGAATRGVLVDTCAYAGANCAPFQASGGPAVWCCR